MSSTPKTAPCGERVLEPPAYRLRPTGCLFWTASSRRSDILLDAIQEAVEGLVEFRQLGAREHSVTSPVLDLSGTLLTDVADEVWRFESSRRQPLCRRFALSASWYRPPFATVVRLVRYTRECPDGEIIGEAVIGTRCTYRGLLYHQAYVAGVLLRHVLCHGRLLAGRAAVAEPRLEDGPYAFVAGAARWICGTGAAALFSDVWQIGIVDLPISTVALGARRLSVSWIKNSTRDVYYADPFRWPETGEILCEEYLFKRRKGRIAALALDNKGHHCLPRVVLECETHLSYPYIFKDSGNTYLIPESGERREIVIYRLYEDGSTNAVSVVADGARLVDATLFYAYGLYWVAYTDLDIGLHDNLCLSYAFQLRGPWTRHPSNPVKIDIRSSRPGGTPFWHDGALYRPAQDCSMRYGAAVAINRISILTRSEFRKSVVARLEPQQMGSLLHGLHTLSADGERTLVDGKRKRFRPAVSARKICHLILNSTRGSAVACGPNLSIGIQKGPPIGVQKGPL